MRFIGMLGRVWWGLLKGDDDQPEGLKWFYRFSIILQSLTIIGIFIHCWVVYNAYNALGFWWAVLSFFLFVFAEIYWVYKTVALYGWNAFSIIAGAWVAAYVLTTVAQVITARLVQPNLDFDDDDDDDDAWDETKWGWDGWDYEEYEDFEFTKKHVAMFRELKVAWDESNAGAPVIVKTPEMDTNKNDVGYALKQFLEFGRLKPGVYDGFEFTKQHDILIQNATAGWVDHCQCPGINSKWPYGCSDDYRYDMADELGILDSDEWEPTNGRLEEMTKLHREMKSALQVFLKYAEVDEDCFYDEEED